MKIEIDIQEFENLRNNLNDAEARNKRLQERLNALDESALKKQAVDLAYRLLNNYLEAIFKKLGFNGTADKPLIIKDNLEHFLGKDWWTSERVEIELGADVTANFKRAFLSIGVIPKEQEDVYKLE
jgi:chromosome segregation ATPase